MSELSPGIAGDLPLVHESATAHDQPEEANVAPTASRGHHDLVAGVSLLLASTPGGACARIGPSAGAAADSEAPDTGPTLSRVVLSSGAVLVPGPGTPEVIDVPIGQQTVTITATVARPGDTLAIAAVPVPSGAPSEPLALHLGDNFVDISVEDPVGRQRAYRLCLRRATAIAQYAYAKASNASAGDHFGSSVAMAGDLLAVGAPGEASAARGIDAGHDGGRSDDRAGHSGAVYVFRRAGGSWRQEAYLKARNAGAGDRFGASLALAGDTLVVGAPGEASATRGVCGHQDDDGAPSSGAVYVFRCTGSSWRQEACLKASNADALDQFGCRVSLSGDTLAVGAPEEASAATGIGGNQQDNRELSSGAVYVFRRTGSSWRQEAYLKASNTGAGDVFGCRVSLSGDTLAVGAPGEACAARGIAGDQHDDRAHDSGAVYVFRRTGGAWQQEAYLKASNTDANDMFGRGLALAGDVLAVGAPGEASAARGVGGNQHDDRARSSGAVYVFRRTGGSWQQEAYLKASNAGANDIFGAHVALAGDLLAVGAPGEASASRGIDGDAHDNGAASSGAVYLFQHTGQGADVCWQQRAYLKASNTGAGDLFGAAVEISGDTIVVGAAYEDSGARGMDGDPDAPGGTDSGAAYFFR